MCEAFVRAAFGNDRLGARTDGSQQDIENEIRVAMPNGSIGFLHYCAYARVRQMHEGTAHSLRDDARHRWPNDRCRMRSSRMNVPRSEATNDSSSPTFARRVG